MPRNLLTQADAIIEIDDKLNPVPRITAAEHRDLLKSIVQSLNFFVEGSFLNGGINPNSSRVDIGKNGDFYFDTFQQILYGPKANDGWGTGVVIPGVGFMGCRRQHNRNNPKQQASLYCHKKQ